MEFAYRVRDRQGNISKGKLEAEDRNTVISSLINQQYYILSLELVQYSSKSLSLSGGFVKVKTRDLVVMTRQLATMMAAGLPILRAFTILAEQASNRRLKHALEMVREDIQEGTALYQALAKHPEIFSPIFINMIRAGELGGVMEPVLERLSEHLEREQEVNAKVKSASIYPTIILILALVMVSGLITFVIPNFVSMFEETGSTLPGPTLALIAISDFIRSNWLYLLIGIALFVYTIKFIGKTPGGRLFYDNIYLHLPVAGSTIARIAVARFARTMGTMVKSGIPIVTALEVSEDVVGNAVISRAIGQARESIKEGQPMSIPLQATGIFEPMVTQMISVGEETGSLDEMLVKMADYFDREIIYMVDALMAVVEPMLILLVAVLVGGIVVATLLPIFQLASTVG